MQAMTPTSSEIGSDKFEFETQQLRDAVVRLREYRDQLQEEATLAADQYPHEPVSTGSRPSRSPRTSIIVAHARTEADLAGYDTRLGVLDDTIDELHMRIEARITTASGPARTTTSSRDNAQ